MKRFYSQLILSSLLFLVLLFTGLTSLRAQQFITQVNGLNAYVHLPDDYNTTTGKYPIIIFIPGIGEVGTDASKLLINGPSRFVAQGNKMQFVVNGVTEKPIVISIQPKVAWPKPDFLKKTYDSIISRWRVDVNRIYFTGLSMGGSAHNTFIGYSELYGNQPAAIVAMSSPPSPYSYANYKWFAQSGAKWWGFEGNTDYRGNKRISDTMNTYKAGSARFTGYVGGHCCWNTYYDPSWTEAGESIYTFMLKQRKGTAVQQNESPEASAGNNVVMSLPVDTARLSGSATDADGTIASYHWSKISGPGEAVITSPNSARTTVTDQVAGSYAYELMVIDNGGALGKDTVTITVSNATAVHNFPGRVEAESYDGMMGVQKPATKDAGGGGCVGYIAKDDWFEYSANVATAGDYLASFRVSSLSAGQFSIHNAGGTVLATINVPQTGANQNWTTITATINLPAGDQKLRLVSNTSGSAGNSSWNINWFEFAESATATNSTASGQTFKTTGISSEAGQGSTQTLFRMFPNPAVSTFALELNNIHTGPMKVQVLDMMGRVRKEFSLTKNQQLTKMNLSVSELSAGSYFIRVQIGNWSEAQKLLKL